MVFKVGVGVVFVAYCINLRLKMDAIDRHFSMNEGAAWSLVVMCVSWLCGCSSLLSSSLLRSSCVFIVNYLFMTRLCHAL